MRHAFWLAFFPCQNRSKQSLVGSLEIYTHVSEPKTGCHNIAANRSLIK
jgi:hypothetical protein